MYLEAQILEASRPSTALGLKVLENKHLRLMKDDQLSDLIETNETFWLRGFLGPPVYEGIESFENSIPKTSGGWRNRDHSLRKHRHGSFDLLALFLAEP